LQATGICRYDIIWTMTWWQVGNKSRDNRPPGLTDVGGNEEGDTGSENLALLQKFVKEDNYQGCGDKLDDEEQAYTSAEIRGLAIETSENLNSGLAE
jgi:hypothetical protein